MGHLEYLVIGLLASIAIVGMVARHMGFKTSNSRRHHPNAIVGLIACLLQGKDR